MPVNKTFVLLSHVLPSDNKSSVISGGKISYIEIRLELGRCISVQTGLILVHSNSLPRSNRPIDQLSNRKTSVDTFCCPVSILILVRRHLYIETTPRSRFLSNQISMNFGYMMASSNGNIFCVTGPLRGEFTVHRWILRTKASDAELWCFLWPGLEETVE